MLLIKCSQKWVAEFASVKKIFVPIQKDHTKGENLLLLWSSLTGLDSQ